MTQRHTEKAERQMSVLLKCLSKNANLGSGPSGRLEHLRGRASTQPLLLFLKVENVGL